MVRIAFLSTAHIHVRGFLESVAQGTSGGAIHAIWDDVPERGMRFAAEFGVPFVAELGTLLGDRQVDAFALCAENTRHADLLAAALAAKRPLFVEKPVVTTVRQARRIARLIRKAAAPVVTGYIQPHFGEVRGAAALLREGALGKPVRARFRNAHHAAYGRWFDAPELQWFVTPGLAGGGGFLDMGTHAVHLLRTLFGPVTEVWATIGNASGQYPEVDDFGLAHLRFASGVLGTAEGGWTQTGGPRGLEITGREKTLYSQGNDTLLQAPNGPPEPALRLDPAPMRMDRLVAAVRGAVPEEEWRSEVAAALDAVAIMEACYESAARGRWVKVDVIA